MSLPPVKDEPGIENRVSAVPDSRLGSIASRAGSWWGRLDDDVGAPLGGALRRALGEAAELAGGVTVGDTRWVGDGRGDTTFPATMLGDAATDSPGPATQPDITANETTTKSAVRTPTMVDIGRSLGRDGARFDRSIVLAARSTLGRGSKAAPVGKRGANRAASPAHADP